MGEWVSEWISQSVCLIVLQSARLSVNWMSQWVKWVNDAKKMYQAWLNLFTKWMIGWRHYSQRKTWWLKWCMSSTLCNVTGNEVPILLTKRLAAPDIIDLMVACNLLILKSQPATSVIYQILKCRNVNIDFVSHFKWRLVNLWRLDTMKSIWKVIFRTQNTLPLYVT